MEKVTLKINHGLFCVEDIYVGLDREQVYVCYALRNTIGEWELTVGCSPAEVQDRVYLSVMNKEMQASVVEKALPILLNALEIQSIKPDSPEELEAYKEAIRSLSLAGRPVTS